MQTNRAFTLVETLVAITVLMIAIAGPLTITNKALRAALYARNQVVANYLAQDALEMVKNIRDNNYLVNGNTTWPPASLSSCVSASCTIDTTPSVPTISSGQAILCNDSTTGKFTHICSSPNTPTQFRRTFRLTQSPTNVNEYNVAVTVVWSENSIQFTEVLRGPIYNAIR